MKPYNPFLIHRARAMRRAMTAPELRFWCECLRAGPFRFRRQRPIGSYIADFYCSRLKLVIEIDGDSHFDGRAQQYDQERTRYFESLGLTVIRFGNDEVMRQIDGVRVRLAEIFARLHEKT